MKLLVFNYPIADFITNAQVLSMYRANTTFDNGGEPLVTDTILSNSDTQILTRYLKAGSVLVADVMSGYAHDIVDSQGVITALNPYQFDATLGELTHQLIYRLNMPDAFLTSATSGIDEAIRDGLENYLLFRTAKHRATEFQSYEMDWEKCLSNIRGYLNRRTESVRRDYNLF